MQNVREAWVIESRLRGKKTIVSKMKSAAQSVYKVKECEYFLNELFIKFRSQNIRCLTKWRSVQLVPL